jgi:hypothetical protein
VHMLPLLDRFSGDRRPSLDPTHRFPGRIPVLNCGLAEEKWDEAGLGEIDVESWVDEVAVIWELRCSRLSVCWEMQKTFVDCHYVAGLSHQLFG